MIPLLSPRPFSDMTPEEYKKYIESLYIEPVRAAPPADWTVTVNKKGTPVIRINRKPRYLLPSEVKVIADEIGWTFQALWLRLKKNKTEIRIKNVIAEKK